MSKYRKTIQEKIRNFCIISHIDHGKSTLADRFLEITKTVSKEKIEDQYLDKMSLEREHGITIKMHPVRMIYQPKILNSKYEIQSTNQNPKLQTSELEINNSEYILNLIDTPGHVDFSYEVSRALAAVEGAVLLVDATKGVQAQTIANLEMAKKENLVIVPAVNKIDLPHARIEETVKELSDLLKVPAEEILKISAKEGINIESLIKKIIEKIPPPPIPKEENFRALIFDSKYDSFQGVVAYIRVFSGEIKKNDNKIFFLEKKKEGLIKEIGHFSPDFIGADKLLAGEIGYVKTGIKNPEDVRIGDTIILLKDKDIKIVPMAGYKEPKPVIFSSVFPKDKTTFDDLREAIEELHLSDPSFSFEEERKKLIGIGFRCGFLGLLHFEIFLERLKRDFGLDIFVVRPTVPLKVILKDGKEQIISSAEDFPEPNRIQMTEEPWVSLEIITPIQYFNNVLNLFRSFKIIFLSSENFGAEKLKIHCQMPFRKMIEGFYDKLKSVSQGFSSMSFEISGWKKVELLKLDVLIMKKAEPSLSKIVEKSEAQKEAKEMVEKIKEVFPPQLFSVPIQAAIGGKIIARETIKAKRKDVTAPLYGGDITRKMKLLKKQKKGKEKLAKEAKLSVPDEVIIKLLKK